MLVEDTRQGDWLRTGRRGIAELLISYKLKSVCKLAATMKENGQTGAPIYKEVTALCRQKREKRVLQKHAQHDQETHGNRDLGGGEVGKWRGKSLPEVLETLGNHWRSKKGKKDWFMVGTTEESGWATDEGIWLLGRDGVSRKFVSWRLLSRNYEPTDM